MTVFSKALSLFSPISPPHSPRLPSSAFAYCKKLASGKAWEQGQPTHVYEMMVHQKTKWELYALSVMQIHAKYTYNQLPGLSTIQKNMLPTPKAVHALARLQLCYIINNLNNVQRTEGLGYSQQVVTISSRENCPQINDFIDDNYMLIFFLHHSNEKLVDDWD